MTNLLKVQQEFAKHIFSKSSKKILKEINHPEFEALQRLDIYRNNVIGNFESVLSSIYQVTKKNLGEKKFEILAKKFCRKFPSRSGDLNQFGAEFPVFLKSLKDKKFRFISDLAQLELLYHQAFFKKVSKEKFDLKKFKRIREKDYAKLSFDIDESITLFSSKFSVFSIWQNEKKVKNFDKAELTIISGNKITLLKTEEFHFLKLIQKKKLLYQIYEQLTKKLKEEIDIGALINKFISNSTIVKFRIY